MERDGLVVGYILLGKELGAFAGRFVAASLGFNAAFKGAFESALSSCVEQLEEMGYAPELPADFNSSEEE